MKKTVNLLVIVLLTSTICYSQRTNDFSLAMLGKATKTNETSQDVSLRACGGYSYEVSHAMSSFITGTPYSYPDTAVVAGGCSIAIGRISIRFSNPGANYGRVAQWIDHYEFVSFDGIYWDEYYSTDPPKVFDFLIRFNESIFPKQIYISYKDYYNSETWYPISFWIKQTCND
ncbi:MAG: hypothetical protein WC549_01825 [Actinomycetota bacterium]